MGARAEFYRNVLEASQGIRRYNSQWHPLQHSVFGGGLTVLRASVLAGPSSLPIAADVLRRLFGTVSIDAFGKKESTRTLAGLLEQLGSEDPGRYVILMPMMRTLQEMRFNKGCESNIRRPKISKAKLVEEPRWSLYDGLTGRTLQVPYSKVNSKKSPLRFGHREGLAGGWLVKTRDSAIVDGRCKYSVHQTNYVLANDDDMDRVQRGYLPYTGFNVLKSADGKIGTIELPTLMVYQLQPRLGGYTLMRMGMNFFPGGDRLMALTTKVGDFEEYLDFYDPAWEQALQQALFYR
jgi:hypothetical protein